MRLLEKSKSIYEYGSYVYYETGSPAFWRRHCQLSVSGKIPDVACPVPAVGTCRNSCRTCHHPGRVVVPASGVVSVLLRLSFKGGQESGKGGKALLSLHATRTGQLSDIITGSPISLYGKHRFRQDQIHRQTADRAVHQVRIRRFHL